MKKLSFTLLIVFFLALPFFVACGNGGTDTGNPTTTDGDSPSVENITEAEAILDSLCTKLTECFTELSLTECETGILAEHGLENEFGLTQEGDSITFQEIVDAEEAGEITANTSEAQTCETDISNLACSDATVSIAYDPEEPGTFGDNIENMIPSSCEGVY